MPSRPKAGPSELKLTKIMEQNIKKNKADESFTNRV